jgi:hypothetical protein
MYIAQDTRLIAERHGRNRQSTQSNRLMTQGNSGERAFVRHGVRQPVTRMGPLLVSTQSIFRDLFQTDGMKFIFA